MSALHKYLETGYPVEGNPVLLNSLRPAFEMLVERLEGLGPDATLKQRLAPFARAIEIINSYGDEIETMEREALLACIYDIGEIVGIDRTSKFAETWRGDW